MAGGVAGGGTEMQLAFRGLLVHWERWTRKQMKAVSCRDEDLDLCGEDILETCIKVASAMTDVQVLDKAHCPSGELQLDLAGHSCNQSSVTHY